jgi:hypothetical protein
MADVSRVDQHTRGSTVTPSPPITGEKVTLGSLEKECFLVHDDRSDAHLRRLR